MEIRFIGSGQTGENAICDVFGLSFALNEWVVIPGDADSYVVGKLSANPAFEVRDPLDHDGDGRKGGAAKRGRPPKAPAE